MPVEQERLAVVGPQRLVNAFAVEKSVIEHRNDRVLLIDDAAVDVHHRVHSHERTTTTDTMDTKPKLVL